MKLIMRAFGKVLEEAQSRLVRARPGSVLLLVVALLVLMALIGIAFLNMAQSDRAASIQHENNTEIDLLLDGVVNIVKGNVTAELFPAGRFRPALGYDTGAAGTYNHFTGLGDPSVTGVAATTFLASRTPELPGEAPNSAPSGVAGSGNQPLWRFISAPLLGGRFSSPLPAVGKPFLAGQTAGDPSSSYTQRSSIPGKPLYPSFMPVGGQMMPVWVDNPDSPTGWTMAGDADGDGIPDGGLVKLPIGAINGVTYYAAVRIVDNNAAVNANVAWQHNPYMSRPNPPLPGDFFPSNIDLLDMLVGADANVNSPGPGINQLLGYRFGRSGTLLAALPGTGNYPPTPKPPDNAPDNTTEYDDTQAFQAAPFPRSDLPIVPYLEASWNGVGRRPKNPGFWGAGSGANPPGPPPPVQFSALPLGEALNLAHQFVIADPTARPSVLGQSLPQSLYQNSPMQPYPASPASVLRWFNQNFAFLASHYWTTDPPSSTTPIRSILATENGVSNFCPTKFRDIGSILDKWQVPTPPPGTHLLFGDSVKWKGHRFVCINPSDAVAGVAPVDPALGLPASRMDNDTWIYQPWTTNPVKTSVNTATFGQLLLAYWSVMAEQYRPNDGDWAPSFPNANGASPRMFRSPIRVPPAPTGTSSTSIWEISPVQVMQLRAALAAVNTIDMRDGDDDVTDRTMHLTDFDSGTQPNQLMMKDVIATVYGSERQPFITQVYATNQPIAGSGQPGYIAIELYNPDPVRPLSLCGYALATIPRPSTQPSSSPPNCNPTWIPWGSDPVWFGPDPPQIPAGGFLVIASNDTPPSGTTSSGIPISLMLPTNVTKPGADGTVSPGNAPLWVVHNLVPPSGTGGALGAELMLFRPRHLSRDPSKGLPPPGNGLPSCSIEVNGFSFVATPAPTTPGPTPLIAPPQHLPYPAYHEGPNDGGSVYTPNPADMVPLDSFDFTGLPTVVSSGPATEWYYVRPDDSSKGKSWHFVYPGHYVISATAGATPRLVDGTFNALGLGGALTQAIVPGGNVIPMGAFQATTTYQDTPLQLNNLDFAGPGLQRDSYSGPRVVAFPYGGFARNGDILQVPFIGSYRLEISYPVGNLTGMAVVIEMNPVTMDSAMALGLSQGPSLNEPVETQFPGANIHGGLADPLMFGANAAEHVGRFCPIDLTDLPPNSTTPNDFYPAAAGVTPPQWFYHFATRLFDYLTVQSPQQDYMPDADPELSDIFILTNPNRSEGQIAAYSPLNFPVGSAIPASVSNLTGGAFGSGVFNAEPANPNAATEETVPTEGLININTSPWRVLAAVPWVGPDFPSFNGSPTGNRLATNVNIGLSIAYYRDVDDGSLPPPAQHPHGPFKSIFELNNVPIYPAVSSAGIGKPYTLFRDLLKNGGSPLKPYNQNQGNITPGYPPATDTVVGDFKTKFTMMSRASNLVTTRSDSFTAYILLQGWRDAETPNATLAVQRRAALLIDRSGVTPINPSPAVTLVPTP
ncbi:MAG TPA: hypothetical protein VK797_23880 [Tepidisphaeraceae bacterium]|nr:hypothetical protein [Tepidisphaeraceae bacterium]